MGSCSPWHGQTHGHHLQPAPASGLCIKQPFFLTWPPPHQRAGVPLREKVVAPLYIPLSIPGSPALWAPLTPAPPPQSLALHARLRKALYCVAEASTVFGTFTKETEKGDGSTTLREWGAWQKHAVPGAAGPAGLGWGCSQSRGLPGPVSPPSCLPGHGEFWLTP